MHFKLACFWEVHDGSAGTYNAYNAYLGLSELLNWFYFDSDCGIIQQLHRKWAQAQFSWEELGSTSATHAGVPTQPGLQNLELLKWKSLTLASCISLA